MDGAALSLLCLVLGFTCTSSKTIFLEENSPTLEEVGFLRRYGYLPDNQGDIDFAYTPNSIAEGVRKMQRFAGLPETGNLDPDTRRLFKKRRCGVKDIDNAASTMSISRKRRYILQQGWGKKTITYRVLNGSNTLEQGRVRSLMAAGLAVWAPHGGLHFHQLDSGHADIQVSFASRDHGDGFPFDGPGRVVAHAFPPPHGAMHFDDDEVWGEHDEAADGQEQEQDEAVTDFFAVAVHEIGHALGLSHSNVKASVMYPYYQVPVEKLHMDDILGMQELYLKEEVPQEPPSAEVAETAGGTEASLASRSSLAPHFTKADSDENDVPDLCYTNYDTVQVIQGKIYVFEEEWVWALSERRRVLPGFPRPFHDLFVGLPAHLKYIKAVYEKLNGNIVVFSGRVFWEFGADFVLRRRGRLTEYSLPRHAAGLTTAFVSNVNNRTYLVQHERFWRYDERRAAMDPGYPKSMKAWRQIPYPVDAAIVWKGDTFFFRGPRFWRFDNELVQAHEYYPLPTAQIWFPCPPTSDMGLYVTNDEP